MRPSSESPILDSTGLRRVGHDDKRGGAADQDPNARALGVTRSRRHGDTSGSRFVRLWHCTVCFACSWIAWYVGFTRRPAHRARRRGVAPAALNVRCSLWKTTNLALALEPTIPKALSFLAGFEIHQHRTQTPASSVDELSLGWW